MADTHDAHAADGHANEHGDDHGHGGGEALGPIDVTAWGAAILGIALGLVVLVALIQAVS